MSDRAYDPTRFPNAQLPKRKPYKAHDDELREANKAGIRPAREEEHGR